MESGLGLEDLGEKLITLVGELGLWTPWRPPPSPFGLPTPHRQFTDIGIPVRQIRIIPVRIAEV